MAKRYKEFKGLNLPAIEKAVLKEWTKNQAFEKSISIREGARPFIFYEGPPSANGLPGIHHVISRTIKDLMCRYKTMQGFQVKRKGGWDTHGLPVELGVEKELGITKEDIGKTISVEEYNAKCREAVSRYKDKWDEITQKMGYWVDLDDPYITFTNEYIESLWWILSKLYNRGLLYESVSIQPYSPAAGTGLSSHELNMPGAYKDVKDTSATVLFTLHNAEEQQYIVPGSAQASLINSLQEASQNFWKDNGEQIGEIPIRVMAWTTTPWTLPSNLGLTMGPNVEYALVVTFNPYTHQPQSMLLANDLVTAYFNEAGAEMPFGDYQEGAKVIPWKIIARHKGKEFEKLSYERLLLLEGNSFEAVESITPGAEPYQIVLGDFVTTADGTGIVHTAPAFGADDFKVGQKYNLGIVTLVDKQGKFMEGTGEYSGRYVKDYKDDKDYADVNVDIAVALKKEGKAFRIEKFEHSYPHCWRTDKPILYYPLDAWFIKTTAYKDRMVNLNKTIFWKPESTGTGRFGNWLENMVDWNLSRSRFWGTPLPIWRTDDGEEEVCIGSIAQLNGMIHPDSPVKEITDLHKPQVDEVILKSAGGQPMKRVSDLIDVWFDSGAMPIAQWHFPFENQQTFAESYPADFICEGVDQTRGWFYTLHAISALIKEDIHEELKNLGLPVTEKKYPGLAYRSVLSNGLVLDKHGNKMSKRLGNVVDPFKTIDQYGADATRWYLLTNASAWENLKFDLSGIEEVQRKFFGTFFNTYQFFVLYANVDGFHYREEKVPVKDRPEIDQWILSVLHSLVGRVGKELDNYEIAVAGRAIENFLDEQLSNWYVRLCRRRFWKGEYEFDKLCAYQTLYECLETLALLIAPFSPFFSDEIFCRLNEATGRFDVSSIHHVRFPVAIEEVINTELEKKMELAQLATSLVLSLRKKTSLKVRQPLQKVLIPVMDVQMAGRLESMADLIKSEVNVKEIELLNDTEGFIKKKIKPNFALLGKKLGSQMKAVASALAAFTQAQITDMEKRGETIVEIDGQPIKILISEVEISAEDIPGWSVASNGALTVALDITVTDELQMEGDAREFVNRIQNIRKEKQFELTDRIDVLWSGNDRMERSFNLFKTYICAEILANTLENSSPTDEGTEIVVNEIPVWVQVIKN